MKQVLRVNEVADRFNHSRAWFYMHKPRLEQLGFPKRDKESGGWLAISVDNWFCQRGGNAKSNRGSSLLEILHGENNVAVR